MREIDLESERLFENRKASGENVRSSQSKFYWATAIPTAHHKKVTQEAIRDKRVLEIGCASGKDAIDYCSSAEMYIGVDISNVAIERCTELELINATFHCIDGHKLPVQDRSVEAVIVNSLLHHLDLKTAFVEISRVLTDDGILIFREPLGTNPLYQLYRRATPNARTEDERPFSLEDLALMETFFDLSGHVQWYGFLSLISAFLRNHLLRNLLTTLDARLSQTPARYLFWQFSGVAQKKLT